ncbi:uncharacterized protein LOC117070906 [Trachypithecus francoisi]|uniref:uncharacterized protein LOC117070906 n=1 Tax=Trachypithecus francoisi TaxID=54180 RepID=UPI00141BDCE4|nr:uncharacterized protein LOC117070906 [Trachypithecus francoisi]
MNPALEPLLLAVLRDEGRGWAKPTAEGGRKRNKEAFPGVQGPDAGEGNLMPLLSHIFFVFRLVVCQAAVCGGLLAVTRLSHLFLGSCCCLAFAATSGLEKGRGELGRGTAATTAAGSGPVTLPTTPSGYCSSNQHKMPPEPGSRFFTAQSTLGKESQVPALKDPPH